MIGRTNAFSGGGGGCADTDAMCRVIAPAGSTVTFSRGAVTKTSTGHQNADDASVYDYYFIVPSSAFSSSPWTVTGTLGVDTDTRIIVIDSAYEYDVQLIYATFMLRDGVLQNSVTLNAMTDSGVTAPTITDMTGYKKVILPTNSGVYFSSFDFTPYSTLYIDSAVVDPNQYVSWIYEGVDNSNVWRNNTAGSMTAYVKYTAGYTRSTVQIDISGIGSSFNWMKFFSRATSSSGFELDIYNIYLK